MNRRAALSMLGLLLAVAAPAQETRVLQVHVTSVSGRDVFLDLGRTSGLAPGQTVRLFPPGLGEVEVEVRATSASSARAELPPGAPPPPVGTRGEVTVAKAAPLPPLTSGGKPDERPVPEHPPWTRQVDPRNPDQPLLVPTFGQKPDERPFTLDGRLFASLQWNRDAGGARADDYFLARLGMRAEGSNALGLGERTIFDGELDDRRAHLQALPDREEASGRIDQLSTAFGTEQWAPLGLEVGRFLSQHLPEIGLVDGAEAVARYENGVRLGLGAGAYPRPFPGRDSGEDLGLHLFADYTADKTRSFAAGIGLQKTWHRGAPDRDLLLLRLEGRPTDRTWLYASAKIDYYTTGDTRKPSGFEVTEFLGQARWDGPKIGAGVMLSHFAWPDLKRVEYQNLPDDLVRNGHVDRVSLSTWLRPADNLRFTGRTDFWQDQDQSGTAFELGADWTDVLRTGTNLSAQVFQTDGGFQSGPGLRMTVRRQFGLASIHAGYRWYGYEISGLLTGTETYTRQAFEAGASWAVGDFDLNLLAERWFGSQEDAYSVGLYAQWRF